MGSSPLMRGKRVDVPMERAHDRLIPAHAGKTHPRREESSGLRAHPRTHGENSAWSMRHVRHRSRPRSRGENHSFRKGNTRTQGSSPLTRGKRDMRARKMPAVRLIPAHARKTWFRRPYRSGRPAHPHSRGENLHSTPPPSAPGGSSPLTRGKLRKLIRHQRRPGLIPTHAGKTAGGGYDAPWMVGSSPLTRRRRVVVE